MKQKIDVKGWGRGFLKKKRKVNKKFDSDVQSDVDNLICQKSITKIISVRGFHWYCGHKWISVCFYCFLVYVYVPCTDFMKNRLSFIPVRTCHYIITFTCILIMNVRPSPSVHLFLSVSCFMRYSQVHPFESYLLMLCVVSTFVTKIFILPYNNIL